MPIIIYYCKILFKFSCKLYTIKDMKKNKNKQKFSLRTLVQSIFLTTDLFIDNSLLQSASSCAFGFLFSLLPVILMILMVISRILHANQDFLIGLYPYISGILTIDQFQAITSSVLEIKKVGIFEIITLLAIFWISRRFFVTVMRVFNRIFRYHTPRKNFFFTLGGFIGEVIIIFSLSAITSVVVTVAPFITSNKVLSLFPVIGTTLVQLSVTLGPYFLLFVAVFLTYRYAPGTKPRLKICASSAFFSVGSFFIIQKLLKLFINVGRYNFVYGVLSNLIVLLLEVFIFFQIFLFFAQYIYVNQFFEILLLGELYLLPKRENQALIPRTKRILFIKPSKLVNKPENVIWVKKGEIIYEAGKYDTSVYYITSGIAEITKNNRVELVTPGSFIGEISAFLDIPREATVTAKSDLQLIKIKESDFQILLNTNPKVTKKLLENIAKINLE